MKTDFVVEQETEKAYKIRVFDGHFSWQDVYKWVPKSICTVEERGGDIHPEAYGTTKYKVITNIANWWCYKNLKR